MSSWMKFLIITLQLFIATASIISLPTQNSTETSIPLQLPDQNGSLANSNLNARPPDPFRWDVSVAIYTLYGYHWVQRKGYAINAQDLSLVSLSCAQQLFIKLQDTADIPLTPFPGGRFGCQSAHSDQSIRINRDYGNRIGFQMTYEDIMEVIVQLNNAALEFGDQLPTFSFQVEHLNNGRYYRVASGSFG